MRNKKENDDRSSFNQIAKDGTCFSRRGSELFAILLFHDQEAIALFSNPNSYITHWVRGEEGSYHSTLNGISSINLS